MEALAIIHRLVACLYTEAPMLTLNLCKHTYTNVVIKHTVGYNIH
jgi:hypothetical protein